MERKVIPLTTIEKSLLEIAKKTKAKMIDEGINLRGLFLWLVIILNIIGGGYFFPNIIAEWFVLWSILFISIGLFLSITSQISNIKEAKRAVETVEGILVKGTLEKLVCHCTGAIQMGGIYEEGGVYLLLEIEHKELLCYTQEIGIVVNLPNTNFELYKNLVVASFLGTGLKVTGQHLTPIKMMELPIQLYGNKKYTPEHLDVLPYSIEEYLLNIQNELEDIKNN
jgi:hypothetical protein